MAEVASSADVTDEGQLLVQKHEETVQFVHHNSKGEGEDQFVVLL